MIIGPFLIFVTNPVASPIIVPNQLTFPFKYTPLEQCLFKEFSILQNYKIIWFDVKEEELPEESYWIIDFKKSAPENKVSVGIVRMLYGVKSNYTFHSHPIAVPVLLNVDSIFDSRYWILDSRRSFFVCSPAHRWRG
jgi:hypothetical protein